MCSPPAVSKEWFKLLPSRFVSGLKRTAGKGETKQYIRDANTRSSQQLGNKRRFFCHGIYDDTTKVWLDRRPTSPWPIYWPVAGGLFFFFVAVVLGGIAALFPASFTVKLGFLVGGVTLLFLALFVPADTVAPRASIRRLLSVLLVVWVAWPSYLSYHGLPGPGVNPTRLVYWSLVGLWFFWFVASRDLRMQLSARIATFRPFFLMLWLYLGWSLLCAILSESPFHSLYYLVKLMVGPVLIFFIALSCLRDRRDVDFALMLMVVAALIASGVGMLEAVKKTNLFYEIVPSLFPQGDEGAEFWAEKLASDKSRAGAYRVMSTFTHPLTFGEYLALSLPLAVYLVMFAKQGWRRLLGLIALPAIMVGLYVAHTRSPLLAAGVVVLGLSGFLGALAMRQKRSFAVSAVGFFVLVALAFSVVAFVGFAMELAAGRNVEEAGSTFSRIVMFQRGIALTLDQPLVGYGPGLAAFTLGYLPGFTVLTIDSYYLTVAMESGLPGLALFLGLLGYPIIRGLITSLRSPWKDGARVAVIALALLGFAVVKSVLSLTSNLDAVFLLIALLAISLEPEKASASVADELIPAKGTLR